MAFLASNCWMGCGTWPLEVLITFISCCLRYSWAFINLRGISSDTRQKAPFAASIRSKRYGPSQAIRGPPAVTPGLSH